MPLIGALEAEADLCEFDAIQCYLVRLIVKSKTTSPQTNKNTIQPTNQTKKLIFFLNRKCI